MLTLTIRCLVAKFAKYIKTVSPLEVIPVFLNKKIARPVDPVCPRRIFQTKYARKEVVYLESNITISIVLTDSYILTN